MSSARGSHWLRTCLVLFIALILIMVTVIFLGSRRDVGSEGTARLVQPAWPWRGQAAVWVPGVERRSTPGQRPVPIASVAKIMTALVVLEKYPLKGDDDGFSIMITTTDVIDTERAREQGESLVDVQAGEHLSERDALLALMLPSANNVARILAVRTAGSEAAFVDLMNRRARSLDLDDTSYADASGFSPATISTAADQTALAGMAMTNPTFAWLVRQRSATIPVAGLITTTDRLLGRSGFVGIKTGSHQAAGGCFVFSVHRRIAGHDRLVVGAVLGQRGADLTGAAFKGTRRLVDSLAVA